MPIVVVYLVALILMLAEGAFLGAFQVQGWALHTPLAVTIYLGLEREFVRGGLVLAALLLPIEWLIVGVEGVYSLSLVIVFFAMRGLRGKVQASWGVARGVVAAGAYLLHSLVMLVTLFLMVDAGPRLTAAIGWKMASSLIIAAGVTVLVGKAFARLDRLMDPRRGKNRLEF